MEPLKLLAVFAYPDDESMGMGGTLAKYSAEGVETHLVCATRGERGWFGPEEQNPGLSLLGKTRTLELTNAIKELGMKGLYFLDYIHSFNHSSKGGKSLAVRVAFAAEIQFGLVVDADEKLRGGCPRLIACHGNGPILVQDSCLCG